MRFRSGQRVRITLPAGGMGQSGCSWHRPGVETNGQLGQVVEVCPERDHSVAVMLLHVWCEGTPWMDSYRPAELEIIGEVP